MSREQANPWLNFLRAVFLAIVIGAGGVILNWVAVVSRASADVEQIRRVAEAQGEKLDLIIDVTAEIETQTKVNTEIILFLREISIQNAKILQQPTQP